jgi:hypothetical protein
MLTDTNNECPMWFTKLPARLTSEEVGRVHGSFLMGSHEGVLFRAFFLQAQRAPHCFSFNGERRVSRDE